LDRRFQALIERSFDGILLLNAEGVLTYASPAIERILGQAAEQWVGTEFCRWVHPADVPQVRTALARLQASPSAPVTLQVRCQHKDGSWVRLEGIGSNHLHEPDLKAMVLNCREVSAGAEAEAAWRASEEWLRRALKAGRAVTWEWDLVSGAIRYSDNAPDIARGEALEPYGTLDGLMQLIHPDDRTRLRQTLDRALAERGPFECEYRVRMLDGADHWILGKGEVVVVEDGQPRRVLGLSLDITARKRAETIQQAFFSLGAKLNAVRTAADAARAVLATADALWAWDCATLDLYVPEADRMEPVLNCDTVDGQRREVPFTCGVGPPTPRMRRIMQEGPELIQRPAPATEPPDSVMIGDRSRPSASIMCVPLRREGQAVGVMSIQSYTPQAYTGADLWALQALADYCGGALERIRATDALREAHATLERRVQERTAELQAANAALQESEGRATAILHAITESILLIDAEGTILAVNAAMARRLADDAKALVGKNVFDLMPPAMAAVRKAHVTKVIESGAPDRYLHTQDGVSLDCNVYPARGADGQVSGVVVFAVDTTERQRAEEKLRANEALLRAAFDHAPFEFWVRDRNEVCILQNAALKRHWGDILGKRPEEANVSPEALAIWQANNRRAFAGEIVQGDIELHEGQAVRWMHNVIAPIRVGGEIQGIVGFNLDITDRVLAEAQIRESEQLYRSIVEGAQEGIWRTDAQWRITFVNPRLTEMLGYTEEEMKGRSILDFMDAEERAVAPAKMFVREQGRRATHEAKFRCKDGTELWALVSGNPLRDEHGHFAGTLALLTDITDRKRSERVLQKYTEALRTLSRRLLDVQEAERHALARELHDEVGQNLTTLKLALDRSLERQGEPELATLQRARAVLRELVARVRNLSLDLRPAMLDDLGLVPALLWQFERYTAQTHIEVRFMHSRIEGRRFGPHVETAAYRVVQEALTNVARHAGVTEVAVRLSASDGLLRVQIQDQGRGFDPAATLAAGQSSGLRGMQERASLLGGKLQINSDPGAGTLVLAEFPFQETEKA
jgi:PAS domain S-box-containing protein